MPKRCNSIANALELCIVCIDSPKYSISDGHFAPRGVLQTMSVALWIEAVDFAQVCPETDPSQSWINVIRLRVLLQLQHFKT